MPPEALSSVWAGRESFLPLNIGMMIQALRCFSGLPLLTEYSTLIEYFLLGK
jgi:hypothetical protein